MWDKLLEQRAQCQAKNKAALLKASEALTVDDLEQYLDEADRFGILSDRIAHVLSTRTSVN